jgi:dTDP-4-amino-4,6-dideoxygalactose transaminase
MVVTSDDELAARLRSLRSHGMTTLTWQRHRGHASSYDVRDAGFNYRLDELRAALARVQVGRLEAANGARRSAAARYRRALAGVAGLTLPFADAAAQAASSHHLFVAVLPPGVDRDGVRAALQEERIQTSVHYPPIHGFTFYEELGRRRALPRTDGVAARLLTLPLFPHITDEQVDAVVDALARAVEAPAAA